MAIASPTSLPATLETIARRGFDRSSDQTCASRSAWFVSTDPLATQVPPSCSPHLMRVLPASTASSMSRGSRCGAQTHFTAVEAQDALRGLHQQRSVFRGSARATLHRFAMARIHHDFGVLQRMPAAEFRLERCEALAREGVEPLGEFRQHCRQQAIAVVSGPASTASAIG